MENQKDKSKKPLAQSIAEFGAGVIDKFNRNRTQSTGGYASAFNYDFGNVLSNSLEDLYNSKSVILWGKNPANTSLV